MKKYVLRQRVFLALTVLVVAFIFTQSIIGPDASDEQSGKIAAMLMSVLSGLGIEVNPDAFHAIVRKIAHFVEFAALGISVGGYAWNLGIVRGRKYWALPAWLTLTVAVCDEFIQGFTGRGSMVADVVLDYSGALFGLLSVAAFVFIQKKIARRRKHEN